MVGGWNKMIFKVPYKPSHSVTYDSKKNLMRVSLFFLHKNLTKEARYQVLVSKEIAICQDALLKKTLKTRNMSSQSGTELELGYFRKAWLDLIQVSRLCGVPNSDKLHPAVEGRRSQIYFCHGWGVILSSASALTAWRPSCRCLTLPTTSTGAQNPARNSVMELGTQCLGVLVGFAWVFSWFPIRIWDFFFLFLTSRICSKSVLATMSSLQ